MLKIAVALAAMLLVTQAPPQPATSPDTPMMAALRIHITALASDAMEGRQPGSRGGRAAEAYIADAFAGAGLVPAGKAGWLQPVELVERRPRASRLTFRAGRRAFQVQPGHLFAIGPETQNTLRNAPLIFAGHAIDAARLIDPAGAIVLILPGAPAAVRDAPDLESRRRALAARGARAVLTVIANAGWTAARVRARHGRTTLVSDLDYTIVEGSISADALFALARLGDRDAERLLAGASHSDYAGVRLADEATLSAGTAIRRYASANVIGRLPGTEPVLGAVVTLAHWDHLGRCRALGARDRICNGAVDNASGVAMVIEAARQLAAGPRPRRDILFVATTAEELGLLGARAFVVDPPVPLDHVVAGLNLDSMAIAPAGVPVAVLGRGMTRLDPLIDAVTREMGREIDSDNEANMLVPRQDGQALLRAGIPTVMVSGAFSDMSRLQAFFAGRYHGPADEAAGIELGGAAEDLALHVALLRALADPNRFPSER